MKWLLLIVWLDGGTVQHHEIRWEGVRECYQAVVGVAGWVQKQHADAQLLVAECFPISETRA